ncbi:MAG: PadR family transcriptional regulator [Haloarculaceae archaeon]
MTRWLQSGTRRDLCVLLAGADGGELPAQKLKTRLERHYEDRIEPKQFYGALEALQRTGFVDSHTEGLSDVYSLTEAGQRRLEEHYEWLQTQLE